MTIKTMKKEIIDKYEKIPERQISVGVYLDKVGYKYMTILNTWNGTRFYKQTIKDFYIN